MEKVEVIERFWGLKPTGYGYGSGSGSGSGYGSGDGYGDGDGSGSGSGYGYGDGYGDGSGYGNGDGDGLKEYNGETVWDIDSVPTLIDRVKGSYAKGRIVEEDFTTTPCYIAKVGNSFAHGETLRKAVADANAKELRLMPIEQRIEEFVSKFPSLSTKAKCSEFYRWHHILTGSCTMGRDEFIRAHNLDMNKKYTVKYFLDITSNSYGGEVIRQIRKKLTQKRRNRYEK